MECGVEKIWSDWKTVRFLGEGSFGKVYEIMREQFGLQERSAVKIIGIPSTPSEVQSLRSDGMTMDNITNYYEGVVRDFVQEIMLMSQLRGHANIVGYEDYKIVKREKEFGWDIYIRMELLTSLAAHMEAMQGADLDATVSVNGQLVEVFDETDVVNMAIDMCSALEACHKHRIVHRDIKPDNIFVDSDGHYKLGDFGVAKTIEKTISGLSKKGTPTYMAPEIYKGEPGGMNSDIYSLGIVMYKLLNDNREPFLPPFPQAIQYEHKQQALARRLNGDALPRPKRGSDMLWEIVQTACACDAAKRWQNPTALKNALLLALQNGRAECENTAAMPEQKPMDKSQETSQKQQDDAALLTEENEQTSVEPSEESEVVSTENEATRPQEYSNVVTKILWGLIITFFICLAIGLFNAYLKEQAAMRDYSEDKKFATGTCEDCGDKYVGLYITPDGEEYCFDCYYGRYCLEDDGNKTYKDYYCYDCYYDHLCPECGENAVMPWHKDTVCPWCK